MTRTHNINLTLAALVGLGLAAAHPAQALTTFTTTITDTASATTFTPGASDVYDLNYAGAPNAGNYSDYTNNNTAAGVSYGAEQYFTTGASALGYTLKTLTLKSNANYGQIPTGDTFTVYFGTDPTQGPGTNQVQFLDSFTAPAAPIINTTGDFFTVDLSAADLQLNANTRYAFGFGNGTGTAGYYGTAASSTTIAGASAINAATPGNYYYQPGYTSTGGFYDHTFDVGLTANGLVSPAPEPSQFGMLALMGLGLGGLMLRARRTGATKTA